MLGVYAPSDDVAALERVPFFEGVAQAELRELAAAARRRTYRRGEVIHRVDDMAGDVFIVSKGHVKHRQVSMDGRQLTHAINHPGSIFGILSVIDRKRRAGDAVALTDCEVLVIERDAFTRFLSRHGRATEVLLEHHVASLRRVHEIIYDLAFLSVSARLAKVLLRFAMSEGEGENEGLVIPSYLTQTELAFLVGTSRESVNQTLRMFDRHRWVEADRRQVRIVDTDGLRSVMY